MDYFLSEKGLVKVFFVVQKKQKGNQAYLLDFPSVFLVPPAGIEPATPGLGILCSIP